MPNTLNITITPDLLNKIVEIDRFNSSWNRGGLKVSPWQLNAMKRVATIESIGSSNRIEGNHFSDAEVENLFSNIDKKSFKTRDAQEIAGYADLLTTIFNNYNEIKLSENYIRQLHQILLSYSAKDARHRGEYKKSPTRVAAFDASRKEIGVIFETASPFDTPHLMEDLIHWTNTNFAEGYLHPIIVIGVFIVHFLSIHPFVDGNGRLSRALTILLMLQHGYSYMPYASMESIIEANKEAYYRSLRGTQKNIFSNKINYEPWLTFFVTSLVEQKRHLEAKVCAAAQQQPNIIRFNKTAQSILDLFKQKPDWSVAEMTAKLAKNRETIKQNVHNLVKNNVLIKHGTTKAAYYTLNQL